MPYIATANPNVENMQFGGTSYAPSTNLREVNWKNNTKQHDNARTTRQYNNREGCAISMKVIGYATLRSKLMA